MRHLWGEKRVQLMAEISVKAKIKRDPERWVANWLEDLGQTFEYERPMGGPAPDFVIPVSSPPVAAIEVEELHFSNPEWVEYQRRIWEAVRTGRGSARGYNPYPPVREKINQ